MSGDVLWRLISQWHLRSLRGHINKYKVDIDVLSRLNADFREQMQHAAVELVTNVMLSRMRRKMQHAWAQFRTNFLLAFSPLKAGANWNAPWPSLVKDALREMARERNAADARTEP